jgi:D-alanine--poly(phosphoribitol) ligase subunit 1
MNTMKAFSPENWTSVRTVIFGGEGYPKNKLKILYDLYGHRTDFFNVYGPTEGTCMCSAYKLEARDFEDLQGLPTLGRIAPNFDYLILDNLQGGEQSVERGELCLMGPNLAKGYYNDPDRTTEAFVQNPLQSAYPEQIYRTGDIVQVNPGNGHLSFVSRKDNQVKHMGYRIELEEIEAAANTLNYVTEAVALHGVLSDMSKLVLIVASDRNLEQSRIKSDLRQFLPDYMLPGQIIVMEALPKNANGKIDRRALTNEYF